MPFSILQVKEKCSGKCPDCPNRKKKEEVEGEELESFGTGVDGEVGGVRDDGMGAGVVEGISRGLKP